MDHNDHVNLLKPAGLKPGGTWADFGAGSGAFTMALRELIGPGSNIFAVDKDRNRLNELKLAFSEHFEEVKYLRLLPADFMDRLTLPQLDGILMANSLHFFADKEKVLRHVRTFLKPDGLFLLVEYNLDTGNLWVPHPLSFETFCSLAPRTGFGEPRLLAKHPSSFLREFYSAITYKKGV